MAPRTVYANLVDGLQPFSLFDASLADMGSLGVIPCTASGTNAITLTPIAGVNAPNVSVIPQASQLFSFAPAANSTAPVTVKVVSAAGASSFYNLYRVDGATQTGNGDLVTTTTYLVAFVQALNSGTGGYQIIGPPTTSIQSVVNDINVTGSVTGTVLTLGWQSTLAVARGGTGGGVASGALLDNITGFSSTGFLKRTGAGAYSFIADPLPVANGGTGGNSASGTLLDNISGFASTGFIKRTGAGTYGFVADPLPVANGGTGAATQSGAANAVLPTPTRAGDILYWNGTSWVTIAGNNSGTQVLQENASGVPSWATITGTGTVTSVVAEGLTITTTGTVPPRYGFANVSLAASVATNILTVAIKDNTGADPSAASPANFWFRNVTASTGSWTQVTLTSALSITTNAIGATLGTASSGVPFRLWVVVFNNGGTPVLALWQSVTGGASPTAIAPLNEAVVASSTAISGSATSANTFYTPNGTTVTSKAFLVLGYVEYGSGLTTAGTYATGPTAIQTFGPGVRKPGEPVQFAYATQTSSSSNVTSSSFTTVFSSSLSPTSTPNIIRASTSGGCQAINPLNSGSVAIARGTATPFASSAVRFSGTALYCGVSVMGWDAPGTTSSTTYNVRIRGDGTNGIVYPIVGSSPDNATLELQEIMV